MTKITLTHLRTLIKEELSNADLVNDLAKRLRKFDWYYDFSEDPSVRGRSITELRSIRAALRTLDAESLESLLVHPDVTFGPHAPLKMGQVRGALEDVTKTG